MTPSDNSRSPARWIFVAVLAVIGLFMVFGDRFGGEDSPDATFVQRDQTPETHADATRYQAEFEQSSPVLLTDAEESARAIDAVEAVQPAVVVVHRVAEAGALGERERSGGDRVGSGVVIDEAGYIVASLRTTGSEGDIKVTFSTGETVNADIVRVDEILQLVLLRVEEMPPGIASLATRNPLTGEVVFAIGSPLEDFSSTVTGGVIGAVAVTMPADGSWQPIAGVMQHDAAINQGNEGGPLVDLDGEVIGINVGSVTVTSTDDIAQGWGFAVPVTALGPLLDEID